MVQYDVTSVEYCENYWTPVFNCANLAMNYMPFSVLCNYYYL